MDNGVTYGKPLPWSEKVSYVLYYTYLGCPMHQESISLHELEQELLLMSEDTGYSYLEIHEKRVRTTLKRIAIYPTASQRPAEGTDTECPLDAKKRSEFCYIQAEIPF